MNVAIDNADVQALAADAACQAERSACGAALTRMQRLPWVQRFEFALKTGTHLEVACARSLVLVGSQRCSVANR